MKAADCIANYLNGNLSDARAQAARVPYGDLVDCLVQDFGKPKRAAQVITEYLKGQRTFQQACDYENAQKAGNG